MSMIRRWKQTAWRSMAAFTLAAGLAMPVWSSLDADAQAALPETAAAVPESTVVLHVADLDRESAQWQQTEELLARVGLPDALNLWEEAILEEGERRGGITDAELDALLGGEMAIAVLPVAVERFAAMAMMGMESDTMFRSEDATPTAERGDEPSGIVAVIQPGDPDAAWEYAERQLADLAGELGVSLEESAYGEYEILAIPASAMSGDSGMDFDGAMDDMDDMGDWMGGHGMYGQNGFAAASAGDYLVAGKTEADLLETLDVIDGAAGSLADSAEAQAVASELPAEALSFTYINGAGILDSLDPEAIAMVQSFMPEVPVEAWASQSGLTIGADDSGFRFETITILDDAVDLDAFTVQNDPAVAAAAERAPAGTFAFQAGLLPENAFMGAAFGVAQAINAAESGEMATDEAGMMLPTEEQMAAEIDAASAILGFDLEADLFDLLGGELIAFSSFPSFSFESFGLDAVAAVDASDPNTLAETSQKLAAFIARSDTGADIAAERVGADTIYAVSDGEMGDSLALRFGVADGQAVVGFGDGADQLLSEPDESLADNTQFQTVMRLLPDAYYQVGYIDIGQAIDPLTNLIGLFDAFSEGRSPVPATPVSAEASPRNIRALGAVTFQDGNVTGSSAILYIDG